jgi:hypothetical protein
MLPSLYSLRLGGVWRGEEDGGDPPQVCSLQAVSQSSNLMLLSLYSLRLGPAVWRGEEDGGDPPQVCPLQTVSGPVISCSFPFTVCDWAECGGERMMERIHPKFVLSKRFPVL